ncbi:MAG: virulence-associated E family protein [Oscillospiraceae bacterium]
MLNDRQITISVGGSRKALSWRAQTLRIAELYERLRTPSRSTEPLAEYLSYKKQQQDELKDVGGFVAGALTGARRKGNAVAGRDVLALDLDSIPAGGTDAILRALDGLGCGYCVYSTRKHHAAAPRLRVLIPTDRTVTADEYEPCDRRMAAYIGLEFADPTTFEASRLMYWPSCSADSEYIYTYADKPFVSADGLLATYNDWHNMAEWPQVPGADIAPRKLAAKQGDPNTKTGVVGAFCRCYDIYRAMDELLLGLYDPVDTASDRYTYTGGSTTGGAVVYDDGKFLYSHHATDPCGGKLVNAFDLVRLHKFEELDDEAKPDTPPNRLPSYTAMVEFALTISDVTALMARERMSSVMEDFDGVSAGNDADAANWMQSLDVDARGNPAKTVKNFKLIITMDPQVHGKIKLNSFTGRVDVLGELPWTRPDTKQWTDTDTTQLRIKLEKYCGKCSKNDIADAVEAVASEQAYHPVREYLCGLQWDGHPRLDTLFIDYLGAADTPYTRAVTRKALVATVARVMVPGIKYDTMPVLIGAQGRHKSTILAKLGGAWFSDSIRTFTGKEAMETIQGTWLNEVGEMQAMDVSEVNAVKAFLSKQEDYYRASYGRQVVGRPRQCVFFGTTNTKDCLRDGTGGRRFWPIDIDLQDRTKNVFVDLENERDQIWAEAVTRWKLGEPLHLSAEIEQAAKLQQESHTEESPLEGMIAAFLDTPIPLDWKDYSLDQRRTFFGGGVVTDVEKSLREQVCAAEIMCEMLSWSSSDLLKNNRKSREVGDILRKLGWKDVGPRKTKAYGSQKFFRREG